MITITLKSIDDLNNIEPQADEVILDFKEIEYINSANLRQLLQFKRKCGEVVLINLNATINKIFENTNLNKLFIIR